MPRKIPAYAPVIRYLRETANLSRQELGTRLGVADYYIGYMEDGYRFPRKNQVDALSRIFQWSPFEFALLTDVEIPYPDWPRLDRLDEWFKLANQWTDIIDTIQRYAVSKAIYDRDDWRDALYAAEPELSNAVAEYGFVALYGHIRQNWRPFVPHPDRESVPESFERVRAALEAGANFQSIQPKTTMPLWWEELSVDDRMTIETVAKGLIKERQSRAQGVDPSL